MKPRYTVMANHGSQRPYIVVDAAMIPSTTVAHCGAFKTEPEANARAEELNRDATRDALYFRAIHGIQFLDEIDGATRSRDYVAVMRRIAEECEQRAQRAEQAHGSREVWTAAGFELVDTGGGCKAYQRNNEADGTYILVTADNDPDVPDFADEPVSVGLYTTGEGGEAIAHIVAPTSSEALRRIRMGDWVKGNFTYG